MKFSKAMLQDGAKRVNTFLKKEERYPNYLVMTDMDGKKHELKPKEYNGLYENVNLFLIKNKRYPNYVTLDHYADKNCLVMDYQDVNYTCCPTSVSMASQLLFDYHSEQQCAKVLGTTKNGTSPDQLINNAPKLGFKIIKIKRNSKEVKKYLKKGYPVITHFQTNQIKKCKGDYVGSFGHYSLIWDTDLTHYIVADPSKGIDRKYKFSCMDNANKGHPEYYYVVMPK